MPERVTAVERVFGPALNKSGPTHAMLPEHYGQSWCGVRMQFRHEPRPGAIVDVDCKGCLSRLAKGQPKSWRRK